MFCGHELLIFSSEPSKWLAKIFYVNIIHQSNVMSLIGG